MAKSTVEQICTAVRIVNMLDRRGKLAVLRDLQQQGLEKKEMERIVEQGPDRKLVELLEAAGGKVVDVEYEKGKE